MLMNDFDFENNLPHDSDFDQNPLEGLEGTFLQDFFTEEKENVLFMAQPLEGLEDTWLQQVFQEESSEFVVDREDLYYQDPLRQTESSKNSEITRISVHDRFSYRNPEYQDFDLSKKFLGMQEQFYPQEISNNLGSNPLEVKGSETFFDFLKSQEKMTSLRLEQERGEAEVLSDGLHHLQHPTLLVLGGGNNSNGQSSLNSIDFSSEGEDGNRRLEGDRRMETGQIQPHQNNGQENGMNLRQSPEFGNEHNTHGRLPQGNVNLGAEYNELFNIFRDCLRIREDRERENQLPDQPHQSRVPNSLTNYCSPWYMLPPPNFSYPYPDMTGTSLRDVAAISAREESTRNEARQARQAERAERAERARLRNRRRRVREREIHHRNVRIVIIFGACLLGGMFGIPRIEDFVRHRHIDNVGMRDGKLVFRKQIIDENKKRKENFFPWKQKSLPTNSLPDLGKFSSIYNNFGLGNHPNYLRGLDQGFRHAQDFYESKNSQCLPEELSNSRDPYELVRFPHDRNLLFENINAQGLASLGLTILFNRDLRRLLVSIFFTRPPNLDDSDSEDENRLQDY